MRPTPAARRRTRKPKAPARKQDMRQVAFTRFMLIVAFLVIWIGGISVRLVHLQVNQHEWLKSRAMQQGRDVKRSKMLRGTIFDRNGRALAMSVRARTLYADPAKIGDTKAAAAKLAGVLKINAKQLQKQLNDAKEAGKRFLPIAKRLDAETVEKVNKHLETAGLKKADLPKYEGLHYSEDQKRSYPNNALAAHVLGFSNSEDVGQAGVEMSRNDLLHGAVVKKIQERDRHGRVYDEEIFEREAPKDVVLTLSTSIQYKAEEALAKGVKEAGAKSGMAIVLSPKTGEILALANYPTFDPNKITEDDAEKIKNAAIQSVYSPGSVFKLITYGAALDRKLITPGGAFDPGSAIEVGGRTFRDGHPMAGGATYAKALAVSSNVGAIRTSMKVGRENFAAYIQKFGFGSKTGIELPAETGGIVRPVERWNGDSLASMSIGYEIGVSALQMASAFATIANDGVRVQPHIIKEIRQPDGTIISAAQPEKLQVVSAEAARGLRAMLREVVVSGTGKRAQLNGYTSAGKTGTAWKFNPKTKSVDGSKYISSFIGYAPAEDPELVIAVVMDEPTVGSRNGGAVSAPVFTQIAEQVLPELNVLPDAPYEAEQLVAQEVEETVGNGEGPQAETLDISVAEGKVKMAPKPSPAPAAAAPAKRETPAASKKKEAAVKEIKKQPPLADKKSAASRPASGTTNKSSPGKVKQKT